VHDGNADARITEPQLVNPEQVYAKK
jgi:hypothetical protein